LIFSYLFNFGEVFCVVRAVSLRQLICLCSMLLGAYVSNLLWQPPPCRFILAYNAVVTVIHTTDANASACVLCRSYSLRCSTHSWRL